MGTDAKRGASFDQRALREIFEGTAGSTGERFFDELVRHLATALDVKCAWVTEWEQPEKRLRALSFWVDGKYVSDYAYDVSGTPCEPVIGERRLIVVPDRVVELYPGDPDLPPLGAVSYMGQPLIDADGSLLGNLAVLDDAPLEADSTVREIFSIFTARAAAELSRLRRDRDLREREEKLVRLIDSAMDAILEIDSDQTIRRVNPAALKTFAATEVEMVGSRLDRFFTPASCGKLIHLIREIDRRPAGGQAIWIPDGLDGLCPGGESFPAEATVSRFEVRGAGFYTLILRNILDRIAAEERIRALTSETEYLRAEIEALQGFDEIVGESDALRAMLLDVDRVAGTDATVLITGETGTGKELIARAIHRRSARGDRPLIGVNCAAIAANLQESEFFGHERGAFTGATTRRDGRFKMADGGTVFLDEVGEMPLDLQAKLLRVLQEGEYERVGGSRTERVDVRVVAATNRDLDRMVREGTFRRDLLYRLNVFPIHLPPLRERGDDVVLLAQAFADRLARRTGRPLAPLTPACKAKLKRYDWPGNIRELENVIERSFITSLDGRTLNLDRALPDAPDRRTGEHDGAPLTAHPNGGRVMTADEMAALERSNIQRALESAKGRLSGPAGAAALLGLHPNTLASRMKSLGIDRNGQS